MRQLRLLILFQVVCFVHLLQAQSLSWVQYEGSALGTSRTETGRAISSDALGNLYVAGVFRDTARFDTFRVFSRGAQDVFLAKYNRQGQLLWVRTGGGPGDDVCLDMAADAQGNCYLTGYFRDTAAFANDTLIAHNTTHAFLIKYDTHGAQQWSFQAGNDSVAGPAFFSPYGFYDGGTSVAIDPAGFCYVNGFFPQTIAFGNDTLYDGGMFLAKFDSSGHPVWAVKAGDTPNFGHLAALGMKVAPNHDILLTGPFQSQVNFGPGSNLFTTGIEVFTACYDSSGQVRWARQGGGPTYNIPSGGGEWIYSTGYDVDTDAGGNVYVTGRTVGNGAFDTLLLDGPSSSIDFFLLKYDSTGAAQWLRRSDTLVASVGHAGMALHTDPEGNSILAGYFTNFIFLDGQPLSSPFGNNRDILLLKYASDGHLTWRKRLGGRRGEEALALEVDRFNDISLTGFFNDSTQFEQVVLRAYGKQDIFVSKLADCAQQAQLSGPDTFCLSDSLYLSVPAGLGLSYQWLKNSLPIPGATAPQWTPDASGIYSVILHAPTCRDTTPSLQLTALPQPPRPLVTVTGDSAFCEGDSAILNGPFGWAGYEWSSGDSTYRILVKQAGVFSLRVQDSAGCYSLPSAAISTVQYPLPPPPQLTDPGDTAFCRSDSVLLSGPAGYARYLWSSGATTPSILILQSGAYSLKVTDANGCTSPSSDTARLTVFSLPSAPTLVFLGDSVVFCEDEPQSMQALPAYAGYLWSHGDTTQIVSVNLTGNYAVAGIDSNGCLSDFSDTLMLTGIAVPPQPTILSIGNDSLRSSVVGTVYFWFFNGAQIPLSSRNILAPGSGTYTLIVSNEGCFSEISDPFGYNVTGLEDTLFTDLQVYPNPSDGRIFLRTSESLAAKSLSFRLMELSGKTLFSKKILSGAGPFNEAIDLRPLPAGVYFLWIEVEDRPAKAVKLEIRAED